MIKCSKPNDKRLENMRDALKVLAIVFLGSYCSLPENEIPNISYIVGLFFMWCFLICSINKIEKVKTYDATYVLVAIMFHLLCLVFLINGDWVEVFNNFNTLNKIGLLWFLGTIMWMLFKRIILFSVPYQYKEKFK